MVKYRQRSVYRIRHSFLKSTISVHNGFILYLTQFLEEYGSLPALTFTEDKRFWTSTAIQNPKWAIAIRNSGGCDWMFAIGEANGVAKTIGSQRPALYRFDNYSTYYSCI